MQRLRLLVASPGDVRREREHVSALAEELNRGAAAQAGFVLEVVRWETHVSPNIGRPQQIVFDQIGTIDLFVGIMWQRFGTPTGVAESGTEEEFDQALAAWQQTGRPRILCYFSQAAVVPPATPDAAEQLLKVARFRQRIEAAGLVGTYASDAEFKEKLREHLQQILLREFAGRTPPLDRNLLALLEIERERCRARGVPFLTPNLLFVLLSTSNSRVRRIFDEACADPEKSARIIEHLRSYLPPAAAEVPPRHDWYERDDVQRAREYALDDGAASIDARHLFLGFLDTESETREELRRALKNAFDGLCEAAKSSRSSINVTPGMRGLLDG